jgi:hypothetical protein
VRRPAPPPRRAGGGRPAPPGAPRPAAVGGASAAFGGLERRTVPRPAVHARAMRPLVGGVEAEFFVIECGQ